METAVRRVLVFAALLALGQTDRPALAQWQIESADGKASVKFGILVQPQLERLETVDQTGTSTNLFLRRFRVIAGGKLPGRWTFFFQTDSPNLGKTSPEPGASVSAAKDQGDIFVQDAFVTYDRAAAFKVDAGMMLLPHGRHGTKSAAALLAVDYGPYTFLDSGPCGERLGRDYGVEVRGYPAAQHVEYRLGVFQGVRGKEARNPLRVTGRMAWYPFSPETGYFYAGTYQGAKRILSLGGGFDAQDDYRMYTADVFFESPTVHNRQGLTLELDWMRLDGHTFQPLLPKQDAILFEAGYHLLGRRLTPFVQCQVRRGHDVSVPDQDALQVGAAYWMAGHQRNLKVGVGRLHVDGQSDRTQAVVQLQIFYY